MAIRELINGRGSSTFPTRLPPARHTHVAPDQHGRVVRLLAYVED